MAGEKTIYRKVQASLQMARSIKVESFESLVQVIESEQVENFIIMRYDPSADVRKPKLLTGSIRSTARLCVRLGLLDETGSLTSLGRRASVATEYDAAISDAIIDYLNSSGVSVTQLNDIVRSSLSMSPPVLPTAKALWERSGCDIPLRMFSKLLTLLSYTGALHYSQRRIYLGFAVEGT